MIIPKKIKKGSHIRVIAPSRSMGILSEEVKESALKSLEESGFKVSFGSNVNEYDEFYSSTVKSRVDDLHDAFKDKTVDAILTVIGGYNSNQILDYLNYDLIKENPKYLCGFSDISVLNNAIYSKTGLIGCNGPHFSSWGIKKGFDYSKKYFEKCCMEDSEYIIEPSDVWSDDPWYIDQENREFIKTEGFTVIQEGKAKGTLLGGHVRCFSCLQGTQYFPSLKNSILLLEEDEETNPRIFDRLLQSIIQLPDFNEVKGILIGRFQKNTEMTEDVLRKIISSKIKLKNIPIISNITTGHTMPIATFPIGGEVEIDATIGNPTIKIITH